MRKQEERCPIFLEALYSGSDAAVEEAIDTIVEKTDAILAEL